MQQLAQLLFSSHYHSTAPLTLNLVMYSLSTPSQLCDCFHLVSIMSIFVQVLKNTPSGCC